MKSTSATAQHQTGARSEEQEQSIGPSKMLQQLIADGQILVPAAGYAEPTVPTAYTYVPTLTAGHSMPNPTRPKADNA